MGRLTSEQTSSRTGYVRCFFSGLSATTRGEEALEPNELVGWLAGWVGWVGKKFQRDARPVLAIVCSLTVGLLDGFLIQFGVAAWWGMLELRRG